MTLMRTTVATALAAVILGTGCATTGNQDQLTRTMHQNNRMLRDMQRDVEESVASLNESVRRLDERNEQNERLLRQVSGDADETRHHLEQLARKVDEFQTVAYRQWDLRPPSGSAWQSPAAESDDDAPQRGAVTINDEGGFAEPGSPLTPGGRETAPPADPMALYRQGQDAFMDGRYQEALENYDQVLRSHGDWDNAHNAQFWKAESLLRLENFPESVREYERLRSEYPNSSKVPYSLYNQAIAHQRLGQRDNARELLERIVEDYRMHDVASQAQEALGRL